MFATIRALLIRTMQSIIIIIIIINSFLKVENFLQFSVKHRLEKYMRIYSRAIK